jgi:hypothetical protein
VFCSWDVLYLERFIIRTSCIEKFGIWDIFRLGLFVSGRFIGVAKTKTGLDN